MPRFALLSSSLALLMGLAGCERPELPSVAAGEGGEPRAGEVSHFLCGAEEVLLERAAGGARLRVAGESWTLDALPAQAGLAFGDAMDPPTTVRVEGDEAAVVIAGRRLAPCLLSGPPVEPFRALGQEPAWSLDISGGALELVSDYGNQRQRRAIVERSQHGAETRYVARDDSGATEVTLTRQVCRDVMSGMPHPYAVELRADGAQPLSGCGGEPLSLLAGRVWLIEDLAGGGIIDRSRVSVEFLPEEGRVSGLASCNPYSAAFTLNGEGLRVDAAAVGTRACVPALEQQERKFLELLRGVGAFDIDPTGALMLIGPAGRMKAYAETAPLP